MPSNRVKIRTKAKDFGQPFKHQNFSLPVTDFYNLTAFLDQLVVDGIFCLRTVELQPANLLLKAYFQRVVVHWFLDMFTPPIHTRGDIP